MKQGADSVRGGSGDRECGSLPPDLGAAPIRLSAGMVNRPAVTPICDRAPEKVAAERFAFGDMSSQPTLPVSLGHFGLAIAYPNTRVDEHRSGSPWQELGGWRSGTLRLPSAAVGYISCGR
jgi:hypothetical protein